MSLKYATHGMEGNYIEDFKNLRHPELRVIYDGQNKIWLSRPSRENLIESCDYLKIKVAFRVKEFNKSKVPKRPRKKPIPPKPPKDRISKEGGFNWLTALVFLIILVMFLTGYILSHLKISVV